MELIRVGWLRARVANCSPQGAPAICTSTLFIGNTDTLVLLYIVHGCFPNTICKLNCDRTLWPAKLAIVSICPLPEKVCQPLV